ncbi:MAG: alpha/beta hydrolase [Caulobacteraceae bacterium]|nr:alpha/beta hydrolase [Caulobacteraceae bacterium]
MSPEAQHFIGSPRPVVLRGADYPALEDKEGWRGHIAMVNAGLKAMEDMILPLCEVTISWTDMGGVRVAEVTPATIADRHKDRALMNIHGGAYVYGEGSVMEAAIAAHLGQIKVYAVDYRVPPDHCFPANLEDTTGAYRALLERHAPADLAIFGTSAGGTYTATTVLKLRDLGLPLPAAAGILTPASDISGRENGGDTTFTNDGVDSALSGSKPDATTGPNLLFMDGHDPYDPLISPLYADYTRGFCPAYFLAGTRDFLLSATVLLHRAVHRAGHKAELHVFEGMSHGFNIMIQLPEAREATLDMIRFFDGCMDEAGR